MFFFHQQLSVFSYPFKIYYICVNLSHANYYSYSCDPTAERVSLFALTCLSWNPLIYSHPVMPTSTGAEYHYYYYYYYCNVYC
jgi:hypothetical protein